VCEKLPVNLVTVNSFKRKKELRSSYNTVAAGSNEQYVNYHLPNPLMQLSSSYNTVAAGSNEQYVNHHLPNPLMELRRS
jgi:uncharacterized protein (DUF2249 family)